MNGFAALGLAAAAGVALGFVFFGGLWLTVRRLPVTRHPGLLFLGSFIVRLAIVVPGFYLVMDGHWERALACLAGFLVTRQLMIQRLRPVQEAAVTRQGEGAPS